LHNERENVIQKIKNEVNLYKKREVKDIRKIEEICNLLQGLFKASYIEFYSYSENSQVFKLFKDESKSIENPLSGVSKQAIFHKKCTFSNHIISDSNYNVVYDNQNNYDIRAIFVSPLYDGTKMKGLIRIYKTKSDKNQFIQKDVKLFEKLQSILVELLIFSFERKVEHKVVKQMKPKMNSLTQEESKSKVNYKKIIAEKDEENQKFKTIYTEIKIKIKNIETENEQLKIRLNELQEREKEQESKLKKRSGELIQLNEKLSEDGMKYTSEKDKSKNYRLQLEELRNKNVILETKYSKKSVYEKLDNFKNSLYSGLKEFEHTVTFIESLFYLDSFSNLSKNIESNMTKSLLAKLIIAESPIKIDTQRDLKCNIKLFSESLIHDYQSFFGSENLITVRLESNMPKILYFQYLEAKSILIRFLLELSKNSSKDILKANLNIKFENNMLIMIVWSDVKQDISNNLKNIFKQNGSQIYNPNTLSYIFTQKLAKKLNFIIKTDIKEDRYIFMLKIPANTVVL